MRSVRIIPALTIALALGGTAAAPAAMFRGTADHRGVYPGSGTRAYGGVQWRFRTGGAVHGSPTVSGGSVYVGSSDGRLYALDTTTGAVRWSRELGSPVDSTPAVVGDVVYAQSHAGRVVALRSATGATVWTRQLGPTLPFPWGHESGDFYTSSPTPAGGMILIGGGDGALHALDAATGRERWRMTTQGRVRSTPAVHGDRVFVGSFDGDVYAAELATGKAVWRYATAGHALRSGDFGYDRRSVQSSPGVADGLVAVGGRDGILYGIDETTGALRWRYDYKLVWPIGSPAMDNGRVYATNSDGRCVQAVDAKTGAELWRAPTLTNLFGSASISGDVVYAGDWAGRLYAIDKNTGHELWRFAAEGSRILSTPAIADDRLYVGADDGSVFALNVVRGAGLRRAIFWDAAYAKSNTLRWDEPLKTYFSARGYDVLDAAGLQAFLEARIADRAPSVVVFAMDDLPDTVRDGAQRGAFRRYLDAGGKVVWPGVPPLTAPLDRTTGEFDMKFRFDAMRALLGVGLGSGNFDAITERVTPAGRRWNLEGWWTAAWSADPASVTTVLAFDEYGGAGAWVKRYGGPEGTGFVRIPQTEERDPTRRWLGMLQVAAELFPRT
jgi:eukaryotic-like serine/threonine-protein kinase